MIGIEIGASGIRVVDMVTSKQGGIALRRFGHEALPHGAVRAGVVYDEAAVVRALRTLLKRSGVRTRAVHLAVSSSQAVVREITVPSLPRKELAGALPHLARDVVPIPIDRAVLDFAPTAAPESGRVTGLLVAMPADGVTSVVRAVEKAGVAVDSIDLTAFALLRSMHRMSTPGTAAVTIDLGASTTTLVIEVGGVPALVRVISRGADEITAALSERLGVSPAEAEEQKRRVGLDVDVAADVAEVSYDALRPLMSELRSSLNYFAAGHPETPLAGIRLLGGGSRLSGIADLIARQQHVEVTLGDPLALVPHRPDSTDLGLFAPHAAAAIGLTLGAARV